ncbi:MAG: four helix bundle protein [Lentisphaerae bacterium]|nr:four helix bundle protein [Lentisphaerota bacterium]
MSDDRSSLLQPSGGYRKLRAFTLAQLCYDITVRFVELYIPKNSRTTDQMVQAARSGVQNIAEGSCASATSSRTELKLTGVARASLEELRLDYEDFLRQHEAVQWTKDHPLYQECVKCKISTMEQFREFILWALSQNTDHGKCAAQAAIVANGALMLINITNYLLDKLLRKQAENFEQNGGFSERMMQVRLKKRRKE